MGQTFIKKIYSTNNISNQIRVTGWRTHSNSTSEYTISYNEDTVQVQVHNSGNVTFPKNPEWRTINSNIIPSGLRPASTVQSPSRSQVLGVVSIDTGGNLVITSSYGSSFTSSIEATLIWKY